MTFSSVLSSSASSCIWSPVMSGIACDNASPDGSATHHHGSYEHRLSRYGLKRLNHRAADAVTPADDQRGDRLIEPE